MRDDIVKAMARMARRGKDGMLGPAVQAASAESGELDATEALAGYVEELLGKADPADPTAGAPAILTPVLIVAYREALKKQEAVAAAFLRSLVEDYPGTSGTALWPKWEGLSSSALAFKQVARSSNQLLVWQHLKDLVRAYNEFLNGLLGFLLVTWRCALGMPPSPGVFSLAYANKAKQFRALTAGDDGVFYLIHRLAQPPLRNAIAHDDIGFDEDRMVVTYADRNGQRIELPMLELVALAGLGARLGQSYFAALATILVVGVGDQRLIRRLPPQLAQLLAFGRG